MSVRYLFYLIGAMLFSLLSSPSMTTDNKVRSVHGSFTYQPDESMSLRDAKEKAFKLLQTKLIEQEFNAVVNSYATIQETQSQQKYWSSGEIESKGEWVSTVGTPKYELSVVDNVLFVTVTANGLVREIAQSAVDFSAKVLCNGITDRHERYIFHSGDKLYLSFQSPVRGYLAVYLHDGGEKVSCLLPYRKQESGHVEVRAGQRYIFFDKQSSKTPYTDTIILEAPEGPEVDVLYIIFSPNPFYKALDRDAGADFPRELGYAEFQKWLQKAKMSDVQLKVDKKAIQILNAE